MTEETMSIQRRRLHIGGKVKADGWEVLNVRPGPDVDHVGNANNLSQFADRTFIEIYASHVVEHFDRPILIMAHTQEALSSR